MATNTAKPTVLVAIGALWPGNDSSGANHSVLGAAAALSECFEFRLLARDRPVGSASPLAPSGEWLARGPARIRYVSVGRLCVTGIGEVLRETSHDVLWLNGFFDRELTLPILMLRRAGLVPRRPTIVSPRGELAGGALGLKSLRKRAYLTAAHHTGLLRDVCLHATSDEERADIRACFPHAGAYAVAPNIRPLIEPRPHVPRQTGEPLRIVFVGRISPVKNLDYALDVLAGVTARATFDIYGPQQDRAHWSACERKLAELPGNVAARYRGEIENSAIPDLMARSDLLLLPTRGENFGHSIFEALSCGVPVMISDRTPWRDLARQHAGWDLPLSAPAAFTAAIDALSAMSAGERLQLAAGARRVAERHATANRAAQQSAMMIADLLARSYRTADVVVPAGG